MNRYVNYLVAIAVACGPSNPGYSQTESKARQSVEAEQTIDGLLKPRYVPSQPAAESSGDNRTVFAIKDEEDPVQEFFKYGFQKKRVKQKQKKGKTFSFDVDRRPFYPRRLLFANHLD